MERSSQHHPLRHFSTVVGFSRGGAERTGRRLSRVGVPATPLTPQEMGMLESVWQNSASDSFVTSMLQLKQILHALQVPSQPLSDELIENAFNATKGRFSLRDMVRVLEKCKTIHSKWLHKLRGKELDDDLLEAFVAVGGHEDSSGEVDVNKMKHVVEQFQLQVDLNRIVSELDSDGGGDIDFREFAQLLRQRRDVQASVNGDAEEQLQDDPEDLPSARLGATNGRDETPMNVCLSTMIQVKTEEDLFPSIGCGGDGRTPGEVSIRDTNEQSMSMGFSRRRRGSRDARIQIDERGDGELPSLATRARLQSVAIAAGGTLPPLSASPAAGSSGAAPADALAGSPSITTFYKGGGGLRSITSQPQRTPSRQVGGRSPSRRVNSRSPSPATLRKAKAPKRHKFAN